MSLSYGAPSVAGCLSGSNLVQMKAAAAEQSHKTDDDQIEDGADIVQQSRHHKNKNAAHF
jgi:hypothetical protein